MSTIQTNPYLFFKGNCREAMEFYKNIFGGELTLLAYDDVPVDSPNGIQNDQIMHSYLSGGLVTLMASDTTEASDKAAKVSISLTSENSEVLTKVFEQLSENVDVKYPLKTEFWGDIFGNVTDQYGIDWLVTITIPKAEA